MFALPDLPYAYDALEPYIDEQTMRLHHDKHHAAYVANLNQALEGNQQLLGIGVDELIRNLSQVPQEIQPKVRNNGGGHANHSLFWQVMGRGSKAPQAELADTIAKTFGSFDSFKEKFSQLALGRFGSGWAWLVINQGKLEILDTSNQDSPLAEGKIPILTLDVWEHAYYLKYQNRRTDYIEAWWNVVNWDEVARNFQRAK